MSKANQISVVQRFNGAIRRFLEDRRGASFIEYIIVVGLVAIVAIVAFQQFGEKVTNKLKEETTNLDNVKTAP